ncbi:MAG: type II secretion system F family protein, partial [Planctomycetota bacterium]
MSEEFTSENDPNAAGVESTQAVVIEGGGMEAIDGLRMRLVEKTAPKNWQTVIGDIAGDIERGVPLEDSFSQRQQRMPSELRCLMGELISLPDPSTALIRAIRFRSESRASWRSFIALTTYPTILLVFALAVGIAFSFCMRSMAKLDWLADVGIKTISNIDSLTA